MGDDNKRAMENGALVLLSLAFDSKTGMNLVNQGGVPPLLKVLADPGSEAMALNVTQAFAKLALKPNNRERMIQDGAVPPLVELCNGTKNQKIMFQAAIAVCYLCTRTVTGNPELRILVHSAINKIKTALHGVMPEQLETAMKIATKAMEAVR
jgi:hypothetical protein